MKKNYVVIGIGRFGFSIARALYDMGHDVLAVDSNEEIVETISPYVTHAIQADAADEHSIRSLGISNMDAAIVSMGDDIQSSILVTLLCKELGVGTVIARAQDDLHGKVLAKIGADRVVYPEHEMGVRVAKSLTCSNILECIDLSDEYSIAEIEILKEWDNKTLKDIELRKNYGLNVMAIKNPDGELNISPFPENVLKLKDIIVVIGSLADIKKLEYHSNRHK